MIYTNGGCECSIIARHGEVKPPYYECAAEMIAIKRKVDGKQRYYWAHLLAADKGWPEIKEALDAASMVTLKGSVLKAAFKEAE